VPQGFTSVEALSRGHELDDFDCGSEALNHWLKTWARHSQRVESARTFVICLEGAGRVVAFHTLAAASASREEAPRKMTRGLGRHEVPLILLARLGVDRKFQRRSLGKALMRDALGRTLQAAEQVGVVALMVNAKDSEARAFYEHFGFEPSPLQPLQLFLPLKTIREAVIETGEAGFIPAV
jgi:GNAT superfamily N-acetyltransferase